MTAPASPGDRVFEWLSVLDELTYYELFGVGAAASPRDVNAAFHEFCEVFHPDAHAARPREQRRAVVAIFKRGTEAYLVLSDASLRGQYDAQLAAHQAAQQNGRPPRITFSPRSKPPSDAPPSLEDAARSPAARPFAKRAEELLRAGDVRQAKLQLVMANHLDSGNEVLLAALRVVETKLEGTSPSYPPRPKRRA